MEAIAAETGRPTFMVTVLTMYSKANPERALQYYERCAAALARGREVYIHSSCQPLSFDFTLREPYILYSHDAFDRVKAAAPEERAAIYQQKSFRDRLRENFRNPKSGILFYGDWSQVEKDGVPVTELAKDPLDYVFDLPLDTQLVAKLFQNDDAGVAPLLKHPAGVVALSDAGAHLIYFCDAGFGLHFLAHWVRETGHLHAGGGGAPPDERSGAQIPHPAARTHRAGVLRGPAAVRSFESRGHQPRAGGGPAGRRHPHDPFAARRARGLGERTTRVRRREIYSATVRAGQR